jgi:integrase
VKGSITRKCSKGHRRAEGRCSSRCTRWYFVTEGPRTTDGKRRRLWSTGFPTRKAAEVALRAELHRRDQGIILEPERLTLSVYADRFLAHMATVRDPRTVERYGELLHLHVLPTLGNLQLKAITPAHLTDLYALLLREGRRDGRSGGLSARTVGHVHRVVHRALRQAVRWQLVARNVAADFELPRASDAPMMTLDHEQARRLLEAAEGTWLHVLVLLGAATGARRGELLALRWADLDLEAGTARIWRSLQLVNGRLRVKETKTRAGDRTVGLGPSTVAALRRHRAEQAERRLAFGTAYHTAGDLVVCQVDGRPSRPDYCSAAFRALVRRAGLPAAIHVHTLRHSAASFLAAEGLPASDIAAQLGHADGGALALRVYVHPLEENKRRAAAHLDRVISAGSL